MQLDRGQAVSGFYRTAMTGVGRRKLSIGLRMTPMIDVIFLLLTFFVLTAKFQEPEKMLPILMGASDLPAVQRETVTVPIRIRAGQDGCVVTVGDGGKIVIGAENPQDGLLTLTQRVQKHFETAGAGPIELYCDDAVAWDYVVKVYDVLYVLGARNITFRIEE